MMPTDPSRPMYCRPFSLAMRSRSSSRSLPANASHSGCRNAALPSRVTFASSAWTSPVGLRISGLISARSQSPSVKHRYSLTRMSAAAVERPFGQLGVDTSLTGRSLHRDRRRGRCGASRSRSGSDLRDRLDLHAALRRQHQQVLLGRTVEREAGVVLLVDVRRPLDPQPTGRCGP